MTDPDCSTCERRSSLSATGQQTEFNEKQAGACEQHSKDSWTTESIHLSPFLKAFQQTINKEYEIKGQYGQKLENRVERHDYG